MQPIEKLDWEAIAAAKQKENLGKIPPEWRLPPSALKDISASSTGNVLDVPRTCGILSEAELEVTEKYDAPTLVEKMRSKELSAVAVTTAFCKRAAVAQQLVLL